MKPITVLIADDHTLIRETWSIILNSDPRLSVVAACGSGEEAVELTIKLRPDIVVMDIDLPGINGIEATALIMQNVPGAKIIAVSLHTQPAYAQKMMQNGASGYVTKSSGKDELVRAIEDIFFGKKYICNTIKESITEQMLSDNGQLKKIPELTARELEIIALVKKGETSKEIAAILNVALKTVEVHRYNILKKLKLKNSAELVAYVNKRGLA